MLALASAAARRRPAAAAAAAAARALAARAPAPPPAPSTNRGPPASAPAPASADDGRTITAPGQAFVGDLRSASALGLGDGIHDHTGKWLQVRGGGVVGRGGGERGGGRRARARARALTPWFLPLQTDSSLGGNTKSPAAWIAAAPPIKVRGAVVASTGSDDPALGCPVEYIDLRGTSAANPAVCKYTGLRYYSDDWRHAH